MIIKYEMKIEQLDTELEKQEFKLLIEDGYSIVSTLPVIDNNDPTLIIFLEKNKDREKSQMIKDISGNLKDLLKKEKIFLSVILFMFLANFAFTFYQYSNL